MAGVCRVCKGSEGLKDIFIKEQKSYKDAPSLVKMLSECVNAEINPNDKLSKQICISCIQDTKIAYKLRRNYERTNLIESVKDEQKENVETIQKAKEPKRRRTLGISDGQVKTISSYTSEQLSSNLKEHVLPQLKVSPNLKEADLKYNICSKPKHQLQVLKRLNNTDQQFKQQTQKNQYQCSICSKVFTTLKRLELHNLVHTNDKSLFECSHCGKFYTTEWALNAHLSVHNELSYKSSDMKPKAHCSSECSLKSPECDGNALKNHIDFHIAESRHFQCNMCLKTFATGTILKKHIKARHTN